MSEGSGPNLIWVFLTGDLPDGIEVAVDYSDLPMPSRLHAATDGEDYVPVNGTLRFSNVTREQSIQIDPIRDGVVEGREFIRLALRNPTAPAELGDPSVIEVSLDDAETDAMLLAAPWTLTQDRIDSLVALSDDQLLAAGAFGDVEGWFRLDGDGEIDTTFPTFATEAKPNESFVTASIAQQPDGNLLRLVVRWEDQSKPTVMCYRHLVGGKIDLSFSVPEDLARQGATAVAAGMNGRILVGGPGFLVQFLSDGTLDPQFQNTIPTEGTVKAIQRSPSGGVLVAGEMLTPDGAAVVRLRDDGSIDESFERSLLGRADDLSLFDDGSILVAGSWLFGSVDQSFVWRLGANGSIDPSFAPTPPITFQYGVRAVPLKSGRVAVAINGAFKYGHWSDVHVLGSDGSFERTILRSSLAVNCLVGLNNGDLVVGGSFESTMSGRPVRKFARFRFLGPEESTASMVYSDPRVIESMTDAPLHVVRIGDLREASTVHILTADGTAKAHRDFLAKPLEVSFEPIETEKTAWLPLLNDPSTERLEWFSVRAVEGEEPMARSGPSSRVWIKDDDSAGALRMDRWTQGRLLAPYDQTINGMFQNAAGDLMIWGFLTRADYSGINLGLFAADGTVKWERVGTEWIHAAAPLDNGDWMVLATVDYTRLELWRVNSRGDAVTNNAWSGEGSVAGLYPQANWLNFALVNYGGSTRFVRLGGDGDPSPTYVPFVVNGNIGKVTVAQDGRIYLAGYLVTGTEHASLLRYHADGRPDLSFQAGEAVAEIHAILPMPDGRVLIGGSFSTFAGTPCSGLIMLLEDGRVDATFHAEVGPRFEYEWGTYSPVVTAIAPHPEGKIWIVGDFQTVECRTRRGLALLNADGSLDAEVDPGRGFERAWWHPFLEKSRVNSILADKDGSLILAGAFSQYDGFITPAFVALRGDTRVTRIYDVAAVGPDDLLIRFTSPPDKQYRLRTSADLKEWTTLRTLSTRDHESQLMIRRASQRFYRLEESLPH